MNKKNKYIISGLISVIALIALDQFTKYLAIVHLKDTDGISIIDGVFRLHYLENRGAAFGIMQDQQLYFIISGIIITLLAIYIYIKIPLKKNYLPLHLCLIFLVSGAIGNMIDRIINRFVVDFLYFELINFPIFNVADIYVTVTMFFLVLLLIFKYKEADIDQIWYEVKLKKRIPK